MGKSSPSPPPPPDPKEVAAAQAQANRDAVYASAGVNAIDLYTPWGSTTYDKEERGENGDMVPIAQYTNLSNGGQYIYDNQEHLAAGLGDIAIAKMNQIPLNQFSIDHLRNDPAGYDFGGMQPFSTASMGRGMSQYIGAPGYGNPPARGPLGLPPGTMPPGAGGQPPAGDPGAGMGGMGAGMGGMGGDPRAAILAMMRGLGFGGGGQPQPGGAGGPTGQRPPDMTLGNMGGTAPDQIVGLPPNPARPLPGAARDPMAESESFARQIGTLRGDLTGNIDSLTARLDAIDAANAAAAEANNPDAEYDAWVKHNDRHGMDWA